MQAVSSVDILQYLIPLTVFVVGCALTWTLIELALLLRDSRHVVEGVQEKVDEAGAMLADVKERVENSFNVLSALVGFIKSTFGGAAEKKKK